MLLVLGVSGLVGSVPARMYLTIVIASFYLLQIDSEDVFFSNSACDSPLCFFFYLKESPLLAPLPHDNSLHFVFPLTENNKAPLQRSRSRQNINAGSAPVKAPHAREAHNESEGHPSAARAKAAVCSESGRRYKNTQGAGLWLDRERVVERARVKPPEKQTEVQAEAPASQTSSSGADGESDLEALLARLRAL